MLCPRVALPASFVLALKLLFRTDLAGAFPFLGGSVEGQIGIGHVDVHSRSILLSLPPVRFGYLTQFSHRTDSKCHLDWIVGWLAGGDGGMHVCRTAVAGDEFLPNALKKTARKESTSVQRAHQLVSRCWRRTSERNSGLYILCRGSRR